MSKPKRYRKLPVEVEAEQWFYDKEIEGVYKDDEQTAMFISPNEEGIYEQVGFIETLEGIMCVRKGDWIITGVAGEKYAVKESIFNMNYEEVLYENH